VTSYRALVICLALSRTARAEDVHHHAGIGVGAQWMAAGFADDRGGAKASDPELAIPVMFRASYGRAFRVGATVEAHLLGLSGTFRDTSAGRSVWPMGTAEYRAGSFFTYVVAGWEIHRDWTVGPAMGLSLGMTFDRIDVALTFRRTAFIVPREGIGFLGVATTYEL
jgi:hypothetical protein